MTVDVSRRMIEPSEFYRHQLAVNKVATSPEDLVKFAAARGLPIYTVKLAKLYFEQLALDGVNYASEEARLDDAVKMATSYFEQAGEIAKTAASVADMVLETMAAVADELIKTNDIKGVTVSELFKIASLQQDSKLEFEAVEIAKVAGLTLSKSKLAVTDVKLASAIISGLPREDFWVNGAVSPESFRPDAPANLARHIGYDGPNPEQLLTQHTGSDPALLRDHLHGILQHGYANPGSTFEAATKGYHAAATPPGNWATRNANWALPAGLLGGGAAYLLYRHLKNKDDEKKQQLMSLAMSRRQPGG